MLREEKGVTLIALVVTIIVLLILAGVTISSTMDGVDDAQENKLWSELEAVQHAVVQRYTKYQLTKDTSMLVGKQVNPEPLPNGKKWKLNQADSTEAEKAYYELNTDALSQLGLEPGTGSYTDTYIVNYYTGEVYNKTRQKVPNGETVLYMTLKLDNDS